MTAYASSFNDIYAAESKGSNISSSDDEKETISTSSESNEASDYKKEEKKNTAGESDTDNNTSNAGGKKKDDGKKDDGKKDEEEAADDEVEKYSPHASLMLMADGDTGLVMYEKNADKQFNPGGLVKILTAITAIELCDD